MDVDRFSLPVGADPDRDMKIGETDAGDPVYRTVSGQTYAVAPTMPAAPVGEPGSWERAKSVVGALVDGMKAGVTAPGRALAGEPVSYGEMLGTAGMAVTGSLPMKAPAGSLRSGALRSAGPAGREQADEIMRLLRSGRGAEVTDEMMAAADPAHLSGIYDLPLDEASRMRRAEEMGFRTDMPLYHGTATDFQAFDPARAGANTRSRAAAQASAWAALDPRVADHYALDAAGASPTASPQTLALFHRADRPTGLRLDPDDLDHEVAATLRYAFDDGYDAVMLRNYRAVVPEGQDSTNVLAIQRPEQVRSRFARFDPRLSHLRNLSAGVGAAGLLTGLDPSLEDETRSYLGAIYGQ